MFHIGIDISKFKHDCFIATETGEKVRAFTSKTKHRAKYYLRSFYHNVFLM